MATVSVSASSFRTLHFNSDSHNAAVYEATPAKFLARLGFSGKTGVMALGSIKATNYLATGRYSIFTLMPRIIWHHLSRGPFLIFFIFVCIINYIPSVTGDVFSKKYVYYLGAMLIISFLRHIAEDYRRHKLDAKLNKTPVYACSAAGPSEDLTLDYFPEDLTTTVSVDAAQAHAQMPNPFGASTATIVQPPAAPEPNSAAARAVWSPVRRSHLRTGDLVYLRDGDVVPADMVLLCVSGGAEASCLIDTTTIDGHSDYKARRPTRFTAAAGSLNDVMAKSFDVTVAPPSQSITGFNGTLTGYSGPVENVSNKAAMAVWNEQLGMDSFLPNGSIIRNARYVIGTVVYTGLDTKLGLNGCGNAVPVKIGSIENTVNGLFKWVIAIVIFLSLINGIMRAYHTWNSHSPVYVWVSQYGDRADLFLNRVGSFVRSFLGAVIVYQNMLPMMWFTFGDICRAAHVYFIRYDLQLYDRQTNSPAKPRSWGFTDELGQVSHILTDKTGTLTDNAKMALQTVSVAVGDGTALYGTDEDANTLSYRREVVELRKRIINDSLDLDPELDNYEAKNEFSFSDKAVFSDLAESSSDRAIALGAFWTCATVCHDVSIAQSSLGFNSSTSAPVVDPRKPFYGSSAEEIAVVDAARVVGFRFLSRTADSLTISFPGNQQCAFQVLRVFPFSDDRRRMTVVVKDPQGQVIAFTKGADDAMFPFAATPDAAAQSSLNKLRSDATEFAAAGLRTLIYATRAFAPESYAKWEKRYEQALSAVKSNPSDKVYRRRLIESVEALENQFTLVGAVGIEDPLRPDIPETVETLFRAGMRIWMVTGDRSETAMATARASCIVDDSMVPYVIQYTGPDVLADDNSDIGANGTNVLDVLLGPMARVGVNGSRLVSGEDAWDEGSPRWAIAAQAEAVVAEKLKEAIEFAKKQLEHDGRRLALVVDGAALRLALRGANAAELIRLAEACGAVLFTRATPAMKGDVVLSLREHNHTATTLAIGDGANDVEMIHYANIGIGLPTPGLGAETGQLRYAEAASDFALAQFRQLPRLLFVHGRYAYHRMTAATYMFFYKGVVWSLPPFWLQFVSGWGVSLYFSNIFVYLYSVVFTTLSASAIGLLDQNLATNVLMKLPELYRQGVRKELFSKHHFWIFMFDGFYQSIVVFIIPLFAFGTSTAMRKAGYTENGHREIGLVVSTCAILSGLSSMAVFVWAWHWPMIFMFFFAFFTWCVTITFQSWWPTQELFGVAQHLAVEPAFYLCIVLTVFCCFLPTLFEHGLSLWHHEHDDHIILKIVKEHGPDDIEKRVKVEDHHGHHDHHHDDGGHHDHQHQHQHHATSHGDDDHGHHHV